MSILSNIFEKLGLKKTEEEKAAEAAKTAAATVKSTTPPSAGAAPKIPGYNAPATGAKVPPAGPRPAMRPAGPPMNVKTSAPVVLPVKPIEMVDVMGKLETLAKTGPIKGLNWKQSIADLMALLGMEHKSADIKELAVELGCPESEMGDSIRRNIWTHKALLKKIAANGGNIPKELLD